MYVFFFFWYGFVKFSVPSTRTYFIRYWGLCFTNCLHMVVTQYARSNIMLKGVKTMGDLYLPLSDLISRPHEVGFITINKTRFREACNLPKISQFISGRTRFDYIYI